MNDDINNNTKIEIAIEVIAAKIAKVAKKNDEDSKKELELLMEERTKVYQFDEDIINKVINVYGKEIKK